MRKQVVVPLKENRRVVRHQQLVDRRRPRGTVGGEAPSAIAIVATPFILIGDFHAAAARPHDVVGEHEFPFGIALLQGLFQPLVLSVAVRD